MTEWFNKNWAILLIFFIAVLIMTPKLDRPFFWQDEAETALLARSITNEGIPKAWDGNNLVTQLCGNDSNEKYVWSFTPWLQFYIVAASFKVLGESNFTGRIPFVLIGILSLLALYFFALKFTRNRYVAALSSLFLLLNMQFILHSRQCKYYSILFLIPPLLYLVYTKIHRSMRNFVLFLVCVVILFYTNYLSLFTSLIGLIIFTFFISKRRPHILYFILAGLISLCLTVPFFFIGDFSVSSSVISRAPSIAEYIDKLARHLWYFNNMVFGLVLFIPLGIFYRKRFFASRERKTIVFLLTIILSAWITLPLFNQDVFRYNLHLLPLFSILLALLVTAAFRWSKPIGVVFLLLVLSTNIFSNFPGLLTQIGLKMSGVKFETKTEWVAKKFNKDPEKTRRYFKKMDRELDELTATKILTHSVLKSEYAAYYNELTKDYPDLIAATVDFFKKWARPGDKVYSNFDMLPIIYYLPQLQSVYVVDRTKLMGPKSPPLPEYVTSVRDVDWYFFRDVKMNLGPYLTNDQFEEQMEKEGKGMTPFTLGISSLYWDINWPQRYRQYINKMLWKDERGYPEAYIYRVEPVPDISH